MLSQSLLVWKFAMAVHFYIMNPIRTMSDNTSGEIVGESIILNRTWFIVSLLNCVDIAFYGFMKSVSQIGFP